MLFSKKCSLVLIILFSVTMLFSTANKLYDDIMFVMQDRYKDRYTTWYVKQIKETN